MATRPKNAKPVKAPGGKAVAKFEDTGADPVEAAAVATFALRPSVQAAAVVKEYGKTFGDLDLTALIDSVSDGISKVNAGDLSRAEGMLYAQAQALQTIFMNFSRRALAQEYQKNLEAFFRMALKAQNQCRMTLETLANIKNPPVVFARQANINNGGQQQVNNGIAQNGGVSENRQGSEVASSHAQKNIAVQNELLEQQHGNCLDAGAQSTAGRTDPHLEAVGAGNRAAHV